MYRVFNFIKAAALTAFAMTAGAGCCYRIMAQPETYIMPVEQVTDGTGTLIAENEPQRHVPDTFQPGMMWEPGEVTTNTDSQAAGVAPEQHIYDIPLSAELQHKVMELADEYGLCHELILAVIMTESSGNPDMAGDGGDAIGLMQVQPKWYEELISDTGLDVYKPVDNVELGILILFNFIRENNGNLDRALKQYNSGNPDYPGDEYINKVYEWLNHMEEEQDADR